MALSSKRLKSEGKNMITYNIKKYFGKTKSRIFGKKKYKNNMKRRQKNRKKK